VDYHHLGLLHESEAVQLLRFRFAAPAGALAPAQVAAAVMMLTTFACFLLHT